MSKGFDFLSPWQIWIILGIVLCLLEIFGSGFFLLSLGLSCVLVAIASLILGFKGQIIVFIFGSTALFFLSRRLVYWRKIPHEEAFGTDSMIGKEGVTEEEITDEGGYVKIGGESWPARPADGKPIVRGVKIIVKAMEGNKLYILNPTAVHNRKGG